MGRSEGHPAARSARWGFADGSHRAGLERLCRYVLRPAVALSRLTIADDDTVTLTLRSPWSDGTGALRFDPVDFVGRLAALVPPRRQHLVRYHGVLAPAARWRSRVVPVPKEPAAPKRPSRWRRWADLVERVFGWQPQRCPCCEELMRQVALVRAGAGDVLSWLQRQGDLVLVGPPARGDPGMAEA